MDSSALSPMYPSAPSALATKGVVGVLEVERPAGPPFSEAELELLNCLAGQAAVALQATHQVAIERWRVAQLSLVGRVSAQAAAILDLDDFTRRVTDLVLHTFHYYYVALFTLERGQADEDQVLRCRASAHAAPVPGVADPSLPMDAFIREVRLGEGLVGTAAQSGLEILANDVSLDPRYRAVDALPETRAEVALPLKVGERVLGVLDVQSERVNAFDETDALVLRALADQVAMAVEDKRLYQEAREQAWVSTALLQVASATQSLATLDEVLEAVVELAPMLVGVERCALLLWDEAAGTFAPAAAYGLSPAEQAAFDRWHLRPGDAPALDRLRLDRAPIFSYDVNTDPRLAESGISDLGFDVLLLLPLLAHGQVVGAMLFDYQSDLAEFVAEFEAGGALRDERLAVIQGIAHQAAGAVESARLLQAQQEEAYVSAALLQVAQAVVSLSHLDDILSTVVRALPILVGVERCAIFLWDGEPPAFRLAQVYGMPREVEAALRARRYGPGDFALLDAVRQRDDLVVHPLGAGSSDAGGRMIPPDFAAFAPPSGGTAPQEPRALLAVPLSVKGDVVGAMVLEETVVPRHRSRGRRLDIITGIAHQAALAVQNDRLQQEMAERQRLERELQLAHDIQRTFLPARSPDLPGWELAFAWRAARQVAGDFYDFIELPEGRLGLVIADVADKGMPAALFMALTRTLMRAAALEEASPAAALAHVNDLLVPDAHQGMFVTAVYAVLSLDTGELTYANAGHNRPLLLRAGTRELERLLTGSMALGVLQGVRFEERVARLKPGDSLVLYTDGITEAFSPQGEIYGEERLRATLLAADRRAAQVLLDAIDGSVAAFAGHLAPSDDRTLVVLRRA